MTSKRDKQAIERGGFALTLLLVTIGLVMVSWRFVLPIIWAALAAIMFQPLFQRFLALKPGHRNLAATATLLVMMVAVILPAFMLGGAIFDQAITVFYAFQHGEINVAEWFAHIIAALPTEVRQSLDASGWTDLNELQSQVQSFARQSLGMVAESAFSIGGSVFGSVLSFGVGLYVTYFLLRDGEAMGGKIIRALPIADDIAAVLGERLMTIVRATIKGSVVVALVQGALGSITFSLLGISSPLLFGLLIAIGAFLPAVGPALVWLPVAIYLMAIGELWGGFALIASGVLVIGMADNILRPILVGRDTGIPDWLVLVSTLGGLSMMGLSGIVIGPLIAGMFIACWSVLSEQRGESAG